MAHKKGPRTAGGTSFSGVIFDLDGTLLDSIASIGEAMNEALRQHGLPTHPVSDYRGFVGEGVEQLLSKSLPPGELRFGDPEFRASIVRAYRHGYREIMYSRTAPYPGIRNVVRELHGRGVPLAVLSNKPHQLTIDLIAQFFSDVLFGVVTGQREGVPMKPDPSAALEIAEKLNLKPSALAFVGDTEVDIETARNAGIYSVGVTWGFRSRAELLDARPDAIVDGAAELLELLTNS